MSKKWVYFLGKSKAEGGAGMKEILGGKGANLAEMINIGIPVPPGFTISTEVCKTFYDLGKRYPEELKDQVEAAMKMLEKETGKRLGDLVNPLLVSVRSGAAISMPGMMDTILNLGLNDRTVEALAKGTGNARFAYDSYRRFMQMFGDVVLTIPHEDFEKELEAVKAQKGVKQDTDLNADDLKEVVKRYKAVYQKNGKEFPQDPQQQLWASIGAVIQSWMNERAITYRRLNNVQEGSLLGTAVNIVSMVYGNMGERSGTGVAFTRNPSNGEKRYYGEYLKDAQGEDVVAGIRTPLQLDQMANEWPEVYAQLTRTFDILEKHYKDIQDVEFTIENQKLYMLQTRNAKRTAAAAVKIAVDMVEEGVIDKKTALKRVTPEQIENLLHPTFDLKEKKQARVLTVALPASPGAACGRAVFEAKVAEQWAKKGEKVILVRVETSPEDIGGMAAAQGILTARGGMTSHAAVVARGMGEPAVVGAEELEVEYEKKCFVVNGTRVNEGDWLSLDGTTGEVLLGKVRTIKPEGLSGPLAKLLGWADEVRKLGIRTNADIPRDATVAREFGAEGIGLSRTEHMFFEADRLPIVRRMIVGRTLKDRQKALDELEPIQKKDFYGIFKAMHDLPVTIRLIDPPLHEFLPQDHESQLKAAQELNITLEELKMTVEELHEFNPMLGHRGVRLTVTYPEIAVMQTRAIISAAIDLKKEGVVTKPEIMVPLVGMKEELKMLHDIIKREADELIKAAGVDLPYLIGTMIEVPRGALTADEIAEYAEFFSFGTNDLTQMTYGFSRDDAGKFIKDYLERGILAFDPFKRIDRDGVGQLIRMATQKGRSVRPNLKIGICGEHGGEPNSIEFCHIVGMNYVSCSPYRVPVARLAAAHAALANG
ncbi:MAG TPA: pyruvate, phosphate dikinase [Thermotogota bacterium]|jgi:pyruvate,orthophosphate dikinase|nr:pyruvate, phosphate dikinase [Thermotogota bacterium]OQC31823.1 MAG: Pyruvate, phosphate dikinase [Thermotogota bacterium ADurb.Bin062]HNW47287.1 pyruvate, phosphate dikinase [Thermotogota bacterium]HNY81903.1 pyruvate, phosphate dikinase [Thermotogota bacterium]HOD90927.1 pyruvate, phosphate dikinase [Thermotogota bacterium]